jgi:hypothetical protein
MDGPRPDAWGYHPGLGRIAAASHRLARSAARRATSPLARDLVRDARASGPPAHPTCAGRHRRERRRTMTRSRSRPQATDRGDGSGPDSHSCRALTCVRRPLEFTVMRPRQPHTDSQKRLLVGHRTFDANARQITTSEGDPRFGGGATRLLQVAATVAGRPIIRPAAYREMGELPGWSTPSVHLG